MARYKKPSKVVINAIKFTTNTFLSLNNVTSLLCLEKGPHHS